MKWILRNYDDANDWYYEIWDDKTESVNTEIISENETISKLNAN